jgi:hypothetical protein
MSRLAATRIAEAALAARSGEGGGRSRIAAA